MSIQSRLTQSLRRRVSLTDEELAARREAAAMLARIGLRARLLAGGVGGMLIGLGVAAFLSSS
ncbi:MAG: hypothetical protein R3B90_00830 [Planctomycetaceae bacterium]